MPTDLKIGLALSGGGSRAMAFHLGCLRSLHDRGVLERISLLSSVSGGSVIAAMYAYSSQPFSEFEKDVRLKLREGFVGGIVRQAIFSSEAPKIVWTQLTAGNLSRLAFLIQLTGRAGGLVGIEPVHFNRVASTLRQALRRSASRSTAFERHLRQTLFGDKRIDDVQRRGLDVVINAAELRTGTAFRFGSQQSGTWRFGILDEPHPLVSKAVAASAAYPALLPSFDEMHDFKKDGRTTKQRVLITDGGVYDNLGVTCMLPDRSADFSTNVFDIDFIICCDAGQGLPSGANIPYLWSERMLATVSTIHRRTHTLLYGLLHNLAATGQIKGFLLPYMGQQDNRLPIQPIDLVRRHETFDYPTDFSPMSEKNIDLLSRRGEQLTSILIQHYRPDL